MGLIQYFTLFGGGMTFFILVLCTCLYICLSLVVFISRRSRTPKKTRDDKKSRGNLEENVDDLLHNENPTTHEPIFLPPGLNGSMTRIINAPSDSSGNTTSSILTPPLGGSCGNNTLSVLTPPTPPLGGSTGNNTSSVLTPPLLGGSFSNNISTTVTPPGTLLSTPQGSSRCSDTVLFAPGSSGEVVKTIQEIIREPSSSHVPNRVDMTKVRPWNQDNYIWNPHEFTGTHGIPVTNPLTALY